MKISITTFKVYIEANGLFLLVYPQHSSQHFDIKAHQRQQIAIKQSLLRNAEKRMLSTEWQFLNQQPSKAQKWFNYLTKEFIKTVKVHITDVHIRYQDTSTITGHPFVVGLTLKRLNAENILDDNPTHDDDDEDHEAEQEEHEQEEQEEEEQEEDDDINIEDELEEKEKNGISKKVSFESLSIYLNTGQFKIKGDEEEKTEEKQEQLFDENIIWNEQMLSDEELIHKFEQIPSKQYRCSYYDYILSPLSLSFIMYIHENIELYIHKYPNEYLKWKPKIECKLNVERLRVSLTQKQLNTIQLWSKSWKYVKAKMELEQVLNEMKKERPTIFNGDDTKNKKLWWQYVTKCIISLHKNAKEKSLGKKLNGNGINWTLIENFEKNKNLYFDLYKRKMRPYSIKNWLKELNVDEIEQLSDLELNKLPIDQILIFRSLAIAELKEEMNKRTDFMQQQKNLKAEETKDSYLVTRMLWNAGSYAKSYVVSEEEHPEQYKLSDKERKKIIKLIDFDQAIQKMKLPDSYVKYRLGLNLNSIEINLLSSNKKHISSLSIESKLQLQIRPRSNLIGISCQSLNLKSGSNEENNQLFQSIISKRNVAMNDDNTIFSNNNNNQQKRKSMTSGVNAATLNYYYSDRVPTPFKQDDLIQIEFETKPLSSTADSRVAINISPIQFVWNVEWIKKMQTFFDISHIDLNHNNSNQQHTQQLLTGDDGNNINDEIMARNPSPDISPALSAISDISNISNTSSIRKRVTKSWTKRGQEQLMSALVTRGRHEISIQCYHSIFIIPQGSHSKESKLLVAQIDSFRISNELPIKAKLLTSFASKSVPVSPQTLSPKSNNNNNYSQSTNNLKAISEDASIDMNQLLFANQPLIEDQEEDKDNDDDNNNDDNDNNVTLPQRQRKRRLSLISNRSRLPAALKSPFEIVKKNPHKYDTTLLKQDNCSLIVYDNIMEFIEKGENASNQKIIDSFSYDITIHRYTDNADLIKKDDKPKLFVLGILPQLNFTFSTSTMYTIFDIVGDIIDISKFQHEILYGTSNNNQQQQPQPHHEQQHTMESVLDDVRDIEEKYENEEIEKTQKKKSPFNHMVTKFKMKQFSLQITDDHSPFDDEIDTNKYYKNPLLKIVTKDLCINFDKKQDDIHATLSLQALFVQDLFQKSNDSFKYLITSKVEDIIPNIKRDENKDLISIDAKTKTKSKLMNIICAFNCIHIGWNPECILALNNFVDKVKEIQKKKILSHIVCMFKYL